MILKEEKNKIITEYATHEGDTGSPEVQIAVLTNRINSLTKHMPQKPAELPQEEGYRALPRDHCQAGSA